ncbi:hypothetical protein JB92DRAFT_2862150 [Gautieria morchelliformis]|nr:hypothetical protein JB92DRAFT_2862150 [Gautieria morchelliformis]
MSNPSWEFVTTRVSLRGQLCKLHAYLDYRRLDELITTLPKLAESDLDLDGVCPICLVQFRAHLAEEEMALAMDSPAHASEDLGVTRLESTCRQYVCTCSHSQSFRWLTVPLPYLPAVHSVAKSM